MFWILYVFFWAFPRLPIVVWRRFGTLYQFHLHRMGVMYEVYTLYTSYFILYTQPLKMELIEGSETSENHNRTLGKYPKEYIQKKNDTFLCQCFSLTVHDSFGSYRIPRPRYVGTIFVPLWLKKFSKIIFLNGVCVWQLLCSSKKNLIWFLFSAHKSEKKKVLHLFLQWFCHARKIVFDPHFWKFLRKCLV